VGTIDTGVRVTHQDLKDNFLGAKGWFDPYLGTEEPHDLNGHGTHVTGILSGQSMEQLK
jgi:subtilisin family serine protease